MENPRLVKTFKNIVNRIITKVTVVIESNCFFNYIKKDYFALRDTGSEISMITDTLFLDCNPIPAGEFIEVQSTNGTIRGSENFYVDIIIEDGMKIENVSVFSDLSDDMYFLNRGVKTKIDILIGMDIISKGEFSIKTTDRTIFTFKLTQN
jgi:hypothetical protein